MTISTVRAARSSDIPVAVSFTVEADARLSIGESPREAVEQVDQRTGCNAAHFTIICAHLTHFSDVWGRGGAWE